MKILDILNDRVNARFSWDELYMLWMAFLGVTDPEKRDAPIDWKREEAILFQDRIEMIYNATDKIKTAMIDVVLSLKEVLYLAKIHDSHMQWLGIIDYYDVISQNWEEAEQLLSELQKAAALISPTP
jgi:hypothetical protein